MEKIITIDWINLASIKKAERAKIRLENAGYTLVQTICYFTGCKLVYFKQK